MWTGQSSFNSVNLKNTQTEPQKYIIFFSTKQIIFRVGRNIKNYLEVNFFFYFPENYSRRVRKSTNKKIMAICRSSESKQFAKIISRQKNLPLAGKELTYFSQNLFQK